MSPKAKLITTWLVFIIGLDQISKIIVDRTLPLHHSIPVIENFFSLTHIRNTGAAFGIFAGSAAHFRLPFLLIVSVLAIGFLLMMLRRLPPTEKSLLTFMTFILGGAIGNFIDRVAYGEVIDFFDFYWHRYHWPAFNFADSFITVGVIMTVLRLTLVKGEDPFSAKAG